jgi:hypothetical protein
MGADKRFTPTFILSNNLVFDLFISNKKVHKEA